MRARTYLAWLLVFLPGSVLANEDIPIEVKNAAAMLVPGSIPDRIESTPLPDVYRLAFGGRFLHMSADGKYVFTGDMIDLGTGTNLTESARQSIRLEAIDGLEESGMVVFGSADEKSVITVFTDTTCPYCSKLHEEVPQLNAAGVKVRYLAYPRAGIPSPSYDQMVSVWCAEDPLTAMTDAKAGKTIAPASCETDIKKHFDLGPVVGVRGTPTIVLEDGRVLGGYVPAKELIELANAAKLGNGS